MQLTNNTILITGGTSGFGLEFAKRLLAKGNTVIVTGRDAAKLAATKQSLPGLHTSQSDVSDVAAIEQLHKDVTSQFPKLNMLINNAGEMRKLLLQDPAVDIHDVAREVEINLMGPIRMVQQFLPHLRQQANAAIMNVTSGLAFVPFPISPVYGATKAGLRSYTQSLRVQLKGTGIKVFELAPPASSTPLADKFSAVQGFDPKMMMAPEKVVDAAIKGLERDKYEVYPGMSNMLRIMSRIAPKFLLGQLSKAGAKEM